MNIAFFLIPKQEVIYVYEHWTMRQVMEKMEYHRYTAVPILNKEGKYIGTITEGDLLWELKKVGTIDFQHTHQIKVTDIPLHSSNGAISVNSEMEEIENTLLVQNFVSVVDDFGVFIGIIRRREMLDWLLERRSKEL